MMLDFTIHAVIVDALTDSVFDTPLAWDTYLPVVTNELHAKLEAAGVHEHMRHALGSPPTCEACNGS